MGIPCVGGDDLGGGFDGGRKEGLDLALASNFATSSGRAGFGFPASNSCRYMHLSPLVHPPGDAKYAHCLGIFPGLPTLASTDPLDLLFLQTFLLESQWGKDHL